MPETPPVTTATLHTNHGDIVINMFENEAPKTVANFLGLAEGQLAGRNRLDPPGRQKLAHFAELAGIVGGDDDPALEPAAHQATAAC